MRSPRSLAILVLIVVGGSFAGANLWFVTARSTIPLELHGKVTQKQRLIEKKPGVDDVYIVTFESDRRIQVDRPVFEAMAENASVSKKAWMRSLDVDGKNISLSWSADFRGMLWAMPFTVVVCILVGILIVERPLQKSD